MKFLKTSTKNVQEKKGILVGRGFRLLDRKQTEMINIETEYGNRLNHTFIFGTTGMGKTRLLEGMIEQNIREGENVLIIDPKGDIDLLSKTIQMAEETNRTKDLLFLSPVFPNYSITINPLKHYDMEDEVVAHIMSTVPTDEEYFYNTANEITMAIVKLLLMVRRIEKNPTPLTFLEISNLVHYDGVQSLYKKYLTNLSFINQCEENNEQELDKIIALFQQVMRSPIDYFSKVSSTLRTSLTRMTMGNVNRVIGKDTNNQFIDKLEEKEGCIFYVQTGSMLTGAVASAISKVTISMVQTLVGRMNAKGERFDKCLNIYIDEMASSVYLGIETLYAQARSTNVAVIGLTQSFADIVSEIGEDRAKKLFDLTSTKIILRMNDTKSAEMVSIIAGTIKNNTAMLQAKGEFTSREVEELIIRPEQVMQLKKREFFYLGLEGQFVGRTAPVKDATLKIEMPKIKIG